MTEAPSTVNLMSDRLSVFISSTGQDLAEYRQSAIDVCNELGLIPIAMEFFEAMGLGATAGSKAKLDDADVYVGIVAWRYGYVERGFTQSVTELEFDYAGQRNIDRLCFILNPEHSWPVRAVDAERAAIERFRAKVGELIRGEFTTVDDFKYQVRAALEGWATRRLRDSVSRLSDADRIREMRKVFDRPAFRVTFIDELPEELDAAIDDVQAALNTGALYSRDGKHIAKIPDRHEFDASRFTEALDRIVNDLTKAKRLYREWMAVYKQPFLENWREILTKSEDGIDEIRNQILSEFDAMLIEIGERPLPLIILSSVWIASGGPIGVGLQRDWSESDLRAAASKIPTHVERKAHKDD
jgi:hypothetical protein